MKKGSDRSAKTRLRTAKGRTVAQTKWLERQLNDPYVRRARDEGFRARSVYKLDEIDKKHGLLKAGAAVVDLGAAPGSWSQLAALRGCAVIALDLQEIEPIAGVETITGDFLDADVYAALEAKLDGGAPDLVLSDMAASATGSRAVDRLRAEGLGEAVLAFAETRLRPGGSLLTKLIKGAEAPLAARARAGFRSVKLIKPDATRKESSEIFLLALERRAPA